jgi:hypothetical protein
MVCRPARSAIALLLGVVCLVSAGVALASPQDDLRGGPGVMRRWPDSTWQRG